MKRILILVALSLFLCSTAIAFQGGGGQPTKKKAVPKKKNSGAKSVNTTVNLTINFQGKYLRKSGINTANHFYPNNQELTITKATDDTYDWTFEDIGYMHSESLYGTCKATDNLAECYVSGSKDGTWIEILKTNVPVFTLKMVGNSVLTKWVQLMEQDYKGFTHYFKKVRSFK